MRNLRMRMFTLIWISLVLTACVSTKEDVLPHDGPTMQQIYEAHFRGMQTQSLNAVRDALKSRSALEPASDLMAFTRDATNELDLHFPRLPNPTLVMYVFPHLAGPHRLPVPGYSTIFPLYEHTEYALPGEIPNASMSPPRPETRP